MRGTPAAWDKLVHKNDDTLYFIADADASTGRLYLGAKEIVCDGNDVNVATALANLTDVKLPNPVRQGQVLVYHIGEDGEYWTAAEATATGSTEEIWASLDALTSDLEDTNTRIDTLEAGIDKKIADAVAQADHLTRIIVDSLDAIDLETANKNAIYMVKNGDKYDEYMVVDGKLERLGDWDVDLSGYYTSKEVDDKLAALELGDKNFIKSVTSDFAVSAVGELSLNTLPQSKIEGLQTVISSFNEFMTEQTETNVKFSTTVGNMDDLLAAAGKESTTIVEEIIELREMLTWGSLDDEE